MKKIRLFLVLAMFAVATAVSSQVSLGVKGGVNMSNFYGDELDNENVKIGFNVGLLADYEFSYNSAIQTGL
ncbi:MAG: outer membrane beta-barrel protein, partial [Fermentimonas sp.]